MQSALRPWMPELSYTLVTKLAEYRYAFWIPIYKSLVCNMLHRFKNV